MTRISVAKTAGFCFGVNRAVDMVYHLAEQTSGVKTLGPIIHNPQLVDDLKEKGMAALVAGLMKYTIGAYLFNDL